MIEPSVAQLVAQLLARALRLLANRCRLVVVVRGRREWRQQQIEHPLLGRVTRLFAHLHQPLLLHHVDGQLDEVAHHGLDVAPHVSDLGELRRLDLDERRLREPREAARDLGLADAGRADHQDVLWMNLTPQLLVQELPPVAVTQRHGNRPLGIELTDDVLVEFDHHLRRGQVLELRCVLRVGRALIQGAP